MIEVKVTYRHDYSVDNLYVVLGQREDNGNWLAMRDRTPIFCFEAEDRDGAIEKATAAIIQWRKMPR